MDLHTPIKQEINEWGEFFDNIAIKEENISEYDIDLQTMGVKIEAQSTEAELNQDTKLYSNVSFFGQKPYKCSKCDHYFSLKEFGKHKKACTGESYQCDICDLYLASKYHLKIHKRTHGVEKYQCNLCDACFTTNDHLEEHQTTHAYVAKHMQIYTVAKHMRKENVDKPFKCSQCYSFYSKQDQLEQHIKLHTEALSYQYQCSHCDKSFKCQVSLDKHLFIHTKQKPYTCINCKKRYTTKNKLEKHLRLVCLKEKQNHCDQCDKSFTRLIGLRKHLLTHTIPGYKPYFGKRNTLAQHSKIPTGEKPHQCSYCKKCFNLKKYLNNHLLTHTGQKPFQCNHCEKCFSKKQSLNKHLLIHKVQKPYQSNMDRHKKKHTKEKLYNSSNNDECGDQQRNPTEAESSNPIAKLALDALEEGSNQLITQLESKHPKVFVQQDTKPYLNLMVSNNQYNILVNAPEVARNNYLDIDIKSSVAWRKEGIQLKVEPVNVEGTMQLFSNVDSPLLVNRKKDSLDEGGSDQLIDVKVEAAIPINSTTEL